MTLIEGFRDLRHERGEEGCPFSSDRDYFRELWESINGKRGFGWDVNPWVWVVEFKRIDSEASE